MLTILFAMTASADTLTVCGSGCDYSSANAAISASSDGDIIEIGENADGTMVWENQILSIYGELTIRSADGMRAELHGYSGYTIVSVWSDGELTLEDVDLVPNTVPAIINRGVMDAWGISVMYGETEGIYNHGEMNLYQSEIAWNVSDGEVGGIDNFNGQLYLYQTRVHHNEGGTGGILNTYAGEVVLEYSQITENYGYRDSYWAAGGYSNGGSSNSMGSTMDEGTTSIIYGNSVDLGMYDRCYDAQNTTLCPYTDPGYAPK